MISLNGFTVGDIIQITDESHAWFPCLLIIDEVKMWGVQAYALTPTKNDGSEKPAQYFNRLEFGEFEKVGVAVIGME